MNGFFDDAKDKNQRDKIDSRRLSAYSNVRRKSEVAHEDAVNRDIDAAVRVTKAELRARKESRSRSCSGESNSDDENKSDDDGEESGVLFVYK
jgi:hypothetical protein